MKYLIAFFLLTALSFASDSLTIYNNSLALIDSQEVLRVEAGRQNLSWPNVTEKLIPSSVLVDFPSSINLISQEYLYDLVSTNKLLSRFIGKKIYLDRYDRDGKLVETLSGTLLSVNNSSIELLEKDDGSILVRPIGKIRLPKTAEKLLLKPSLRFDILSPESAQVPVSVKYLSKGFSWRADYVADVESTSMTLNGLVTISNNSGKTFKNAKIKVVAGDVNIADKKPEVLYEDTIRMYKAVGELASRKKVFSYYVYNMPKEVDLENKSTKQISFFSSIVPIETVYRLVSQPFQNDKASFPRHLKTILKFSVSEPLPEGVIRFYKKDVFLGSTRINHTPKDEEIEAQVGSAFDIIGYRKVLSSSRSHNVVSRTVEITLKNKTNEAVNVEAVEKLERNAYDFSISSTNKNFEKIDAWTIKFPIKLEPNQKKTFKYAIKVYFDR